MDDIRLTRDLRGQGFTHGELARLYRNGELSHVRRSAYAPPAHIDPTAEQRHLQLVKATIPQLRSAPVVSHSSAAVMHRLPVWSDALNLVHLTVGPRSRGRRRTLVHLYAPPLTTDEVVDIDGIRVTSPARTVLDLARTRPFEQAVAAGDRSLNQGLSPHDIERALERASRWPGMATARRVVLALDGRSESPGESLSRVRLTDRGLPAPTLQFEVLDEWGQLVGRSDFCWELQRTLSEFDGKVKYGRLLKPGQTINQVIYQEKLREDALRDHGWEVVRWTWADLQQPQQLAHRVRRAFDRGYRRYSETPGPAATRTGR